MKNLVTLMLAFSSFMLSAQNRVEFSTRLGISPGLYPAQAGLFVNRQDPVNEFYFNIVRLKQQRYAGVGIHVPLNEYFFTEGSLMYTRQETQYLAQYTYPNEFRALNTMVINEASDQIALPVDVGVKIGLVEVTSGLKMIHHIKSNHEFNLMDGFSEAKRMTQMGWQMGVRAGIPGLKLGVEYNGGFRRICEDRFVNSNSLAIRHIPGRFTFNLQFRL